MSFRFVVFGRSGRLPEIVSPASPRHFAIRLSTVFGFGLVDVLGDVVDELLLLLDGVLQGCQLFLTVRRPLLKSM